MLAVAESCTLIAIPVSAVPEATPLDVMLTDSKTFVAESDFTSTVFVTPLTVTEAASAAPVKDDPLTVNVAVAPEDALETLNATFGPLMFVMDAAAEGP